MRGTIVLTYHEENKKHIRIAKQRKYNLSTDFIKSTTENKQSSQKTCTKEIEMLRKKFLVVLPGVINKTVNCMMLSS